MANEFKIKKGLIVTGASGGTVVDIQGSLGQLFSVTDSLTGSIFAVSDISGVPIFDVNSSGLSTFDGLVSGITPVNAANFVTKAYADALTPGAGVFLPIANPTFTGTLTGPIGNFTTSITAIQFFSTNNGTGFNYKIGDDAWIGDINVANTFRVQGSQNPNNGYITFGNSSNTALGRAGTGALTWGGDFETTGDVTVSGGDITLGGTGRIQGVDTVSASTDAANKAYVDAHGGGLGPFLPIANPTFTGTLTGPAATITTVTGALAGNASTSTTFSTGRTNYKGVTDAAVIGMMMWKNYGNNHTIFDASNGTSPSGSTISNTDSANAWTGTYPTLMGWNGTSTYGVRVDRARLADNATTAAAYLPLAGGTMANTNLVTNMNADLLDGFNASQFLRSDAADTSTGEILFDAGFKSDSILLSGAQNFDNISRSGFYNLYNTNTGSTNSPGFDYGTMVVVGGNKQSTTFGFQMANERLGNGLYIRGMNDTASAWSSWAEVWTSTTDGAGSGLDADLLDGQQGSYYVNTATTQSIAGAKTFTTTPISVTRSTADNSTYLATTAFVKNQGYTSNTGTITGGGQNLRLALWNGSTSIGSDGDFTYNGDTIFATKLSIQNQINTNSANLEINYANGDGTTTNFKNLDIRDGKNGIITSFEGSTKNVANRGNNFLIGGNFTNNSYNSTSGARLLFGGGNGDSLANYYIGTNLENFGGNYTKLDLRWHTGIRIGAQAAYGGVRIYDSEDLGTVLFSVGTSGTNVAVTNNLTVGSDLTVSGGDITLGGISGRIQGVVSVVSGSDATSKTYVDSAISTAGSAFLPKAGGTMTGTITMGTQNFAVAANYGRGVFGLYSPTRYQHVWSMGTAYKLADAGTSTGTGGNLYGLAWSYNPDYGTVGNNAQSKAGLNHQLLLMQNGSTTFAAGSGMWTNGTITADSGQIVLNGTGRIQGIDTVSSGTDAANKTYVDNAIAGVPQGDITAVVAGTGLSGGGTSGSVTLNNTITNNNQLSNGSGYITASSTNTLTNKSGNISQWTNDTGYITSSSIPSVGNGTLTVQGTGVLGGSGTFTANQSGNSTISVTHDNSGVTAGTYTVATVTVDATGHVTSASTNTVSEGESMSTIAKRTISGYLHASYFNGSGTFATSANTSGMGRFTGTNGTDTYGRSYTAAAARTLLNVANGATSNTGTVTSVGLTSQGDAIAIIGTPVTTSGNLGITFQGDTTEYINGEGDLITFPSIPQGDITGVTAGTGLTGGGTSGTVTLNVIGGSGITANANDITVDSTVLRTSGNQSRTGNLQIDGAVTFPTSSGGTLTRGQSYAIYQESGSWTWPYPDLCIGFHTGISMGANASYNGMRFFNDSTLITQVMSINNASDGLGANNVYINNGLRVNGGTFVLGNTGVGDMYLGNYATANHFRFHTNNSNTYFDMNCGDIYWRQGSSTRYTFFASTANMTVNGTITQNSDARVKENIVEISDCISKVQAMKGVYYNRTDFNTEVTKVGVIAQEVEAVLPELVLESPETGLKSVAYSELTSVLINAIKEQQEIIEDLKTRITKLEN